MKKEEIMPIIEQMRKEKYTNYLYQYGLNESNLFKNWLDYKFGKNNWDLDVSKMAVLTYCQEFRFYDPQKYSKIYEKIEYQKNSKDKLCITPAIKYSNNI